MDSSSGRGRSDAVGGPWLRVGLLALMLAGTARAQTGDIEVTFDDAGCPVAVSESLLEAARGKHVRWQSVDAAGNEIQEKYRIYFDPLKGGTPRGGSGAIKRRVDDDAPLAEYKYSVVGDRCPDQPLDPWIRVIR